MYIPKNLTPKTIFVLALLISASWVLPAQAADWVTQTSGTTASLNSLDMYNSSFGIAVGDSGKILKTTNGGQTWVSKSSLTTNFHDVSIVNSTIAWVVGDSGKILKTVDGGETWTNVESGVTTALRSIEFVTAETGFIVGSSGTVLHTFDSGTNWIKDEGLTTQSLLGVSGGKDSFNLIKAWAVGANGTILRFSTMGGWTVQNSGTTNLLQDVYVKHGTYGSEAWIAANGVGANGAPGFLKTTNSGVAWSVVTQSIADSGGMTSVKMSSNGIGLATLTTGKILKSTDGGTTWALDKDTGNYLSDVVSIDDGVTFSAWAVGWIGKIVRYDNTSPSAVTSLIKTTSSTDNTPTFTWLESTDDVHSTYGTGIAYYEYSLDGAAYVNSGNGTTFTFSQAITDGSHTFSVRAVDNAANTGTAATTSFTIDTTAPTVGAITGSTTATVNIAQTYSATYSDNIGVSQCFLIENGAPKESVNAESATSGTAQVSHTFTSAGNYTLYFSCTDTSSNSSAGQTMTVAVSASVADSSAPSGSVLLNNGSSATNSTSVTLSSSCTDNVGCTQMQVSVDGTLDTEPFGSYTSSTLITIPSGDGSKPVKVKFKDAAGNTSGTYNASIILDTVTQDTAISKKPTSSTSSTSAEFTFGFSGTSISDVNFECALDTSTFFGCVSPKTYSELSSGSHTFKVRAVDAAGNIDQTPASYSWTITGTTDGETQVECSLTLGGAYKTADSPAVYYITEDCTKRPFANEKLYFSYFDSWSDVVTVSKSSLDAVWNDPLGFMPWGPNYDPKYGALVKIVADPKVYLLLGTEKYWITSESVFIGLNYSWNWIEDVDKALLNKYTTGSEINYTDHHPNYTIVKYATSPKVYRLEPDPTNSNKQVKRHVLNETVFNFLNFRWDRIVTIPASEVYKDGEVID
ncbi:hypothetical protein HY771_02830 [Candidatus Uhrbacteria bacterium]|nr:hypothetical protein [Candidatus Uhrbacteria bacterium]